MVNGPGADLSQEVKMRAACPEGHSLGHGVSQEWGSGQMAIPPWVVQDYTTAAAQDDLIV